jgi:hypothetical protein
MIEVLGQLEKKAHKCIIYFLSHQPLKVSAAVSNYFCLRAALFYLEVTVTGGLLAKNLGPRLNTFVD